MRLLETWRDYWRPVETIRDHWKPAETTGSVCGLLQSLWSPAVSYSFCGLLQSPFCFISISHIVTAQLDPFINVLGLSHCIPTTLDLYKSKHIKVNL